MVWICCCTVCGMSMVCFWYNYCLLLRTVFLSSFDNLGARRRSSNSFCCFFLTSSPSSSLQLSFSLRQPSFFLDAAVTLQELLPLSCYYHNQFSKTFIFFTVVFKNVTACNITVKRNPSNLHYNMFSYKYSDDIHSSNKRRRNIKW